MAAARTAVTAHGRDLSLSNLDKVLYPETGFTKGDLVAYYEAIGEVIVPHLAGRPTTLVRCPDGVDGQRFFEHMCPPMLGQCLRDQKPRSEGVFRHQVVRYASSPYLARTS